MSHTLAASSQLSRTLRPRLNTRTLAALLTGLVVLLAAWLVPIPGLVLGEENLAAQRMPQTQAAVEQAGVRFRQAQASYRAYVRSHDLASLLVIIQDDIKRARQDGNNP